MKTLEFIYQENEIHFLLNPTDDHVMINATEMAKIFGKKTELFLKTDHAKAFIKVMEKELNQTPNEGQITSEKVANRQPNGGQIIQNRGRNGIYFERKLALKFAAWLSPEFEYWVFSTIDKIVYGNLKDHRDAMKAEIEAKEKAKQLKQELIANPGEDTVTAYFENEDQIKNAQSKKAKAVRLQKTLFEQDFIKE